MADSTDTKRADDNTTQTTADSEGEEKKSCCPGCKVQIIPSLIPIKLFYFTFIGGIGTVLPFVAVFLKQIGLTPQQIGLISGIRPIIGFLSAPLWGAFADRFNIRRILLLISITAWLGFYTGFYFIPAPERVSECPPELANLTNALDNSQEALNTTALKLDKYKEVLLWIYRSDSVQTVFLISLIVIVGGEFFQSPTTALSDAGTLQTLGKEGIADYGAQRAWGAVGWGLSSFLAGAVVSNTRKREVWCGIELHFSDYYIVSYIFVGFMVIAMVCAANIRFNDKKEDTENLELTPKSGASPPQNNSADESHNTLAVLRLFYNVHYGSWLTTAFYVGVCNGVIWGFLFWHLENLGADQLLMGVDSVVTCTAEFVAFFLVGPLLKVIGHMEIMYLGLVGYAIRFCVYAMITNPWWVLPADILQGVTFSCVWVSLTSYTAESVPVASFATVQGIMHGAYFGLGSGTGHLIGGICIGYFGAKITFFSMAATSILVLVVFMGAQKCSRKPGITVEGYENLDKKGKLPE